MTEARTFGRWQLHEQLGQPGGNADVYRATSSGGQEVALKLIRAKKAQAEPYRRFVREIETLRGLTDTTGILPVVESYLPVRPSKGDQPWLAMPIAEPLDGALVGEPLEVIVEAVATVASTLARLHGEGIAHRDVKPANLYRLNDQWLVGDFGLVKTPEPSDLTLPDGRLGPAHFTAYEIIANPAAADPKPADVYSLAKTLWVLARNERFPPDGHQPAGMRRFEVGDIRPHPNAHLLDALIDRATLIHFENRPTMAELADELRRWLSLTPGEAVIDISDIRAKFRAKVDATLAEEDVADQRKELAFVAVRHLTDLLSPLNRALVDLHPRAAIEANPDEAMGHLTRTRAVSGSPDITFRHQRQSHISLEHGYRDFALRFARGLELTAGGALILHLAMLVGATRTMGGIKFQWVPDAWSAPVGSVEAEEMLRTAVHEAATQLHEAIVAFAEGAPESGAPG
jgi:serine/threonine protein kinase